MSRQKIIKPNDHHHPYNTAVVANEEYWDYNFRIQGVVYEVSVKKSDGTLYIERDPQQEVAL